MPWSSPAYEYLEDDNKKWTSYPGYKSVILYSRYCVYRNFPYHTTMYCIILYCTLLYCHVPYCHVLWFNVLYDTVTYFVILEYA